MHAPFVEEVIFSVRLYVPELVIVVQSVMFVARAGHAIRNKVMSMVMRTCSDFMLLQAHFE